MHHVTTIDKQSSVVKAAFVIACEYAYTIIRILFL